MNFIIVLQTPPVGFVHLFECAQLALNSVLNTAMAQILVDVGIIKIFVASNFFDDRALFRFTNYFLIALLGFMIYLSRRIRQFKLAKQVAIGARFVLRLQSLQRPIFLHQNPLFPDYIIYLLFLLFQILQMGPALKFKLPRFLVDLAADCVGIRDHPPKRIVNLKSACLIYRDPLLLDHFEKFWKLFNHDCLNHPIWSHDFRSARLLTCFGFQFHQ